jgi:hypothetical protein
VSATGTQTSTARRSLSNAVSTSQYRPRRSASVKSTPRRWITRSMRPKARTGDDHIEQMAGVSVLACHRTEVLAQALVVPSVRKQRVEFGDLVETKRRERPGFCPEQACVMGRALTAVTNRGESGIREAAETWVVVVTRDPVAVRDSSRTRSRAAIRTARIRRRALDPSAADRS